MPAVNIVADPSLDASKVAAAAHEAVKSGIGKPDMYITVAVTSGVVMVGGKPGKVLAQVESIGGDFAGSDLSFAGGDRLGWRSYGHLPIGGHEGVCDERRAAWLDAH